MTKPVLKIVLVSGSVLLIVLAMSGLLRVQGQHQQYLLNRQLIDALERGHAGEALRLVRAGADPNTRVEVFEAPSLRQRIQQILHSRASAPTPVNVSPTALQLACGVRLESTPSGSDKETVALLDDPQLIPVMLEHGADVNASTNAWSALEATMLKDRPHLAALLLEHGADIKDWRSLESVVPSPRLVEILVQHGVDVNASLHGRSHFIMAVEAGTDPALVEMLLKHGADANAQDDNGITVLMKANERLVPLLLRYGADATKTDKEGRTALYHCIEQGTVGRVEALLKYTGVNARDHHGMTPLHYAAQKLNAGALEVLIKHGADVNAVDDQGRTPLLTIVEAPLSNFSDDTQGHVWWNHVESDSIALDSDQQIVKRKHSVAILLASQADVNRSDTKGMTPLMCVAATGDTGIMKLLLRHGARMNRQDTRGNTALHHAVWSAVEGNGAEDTTALLLHHHANFRLKNRYGETPRGMLPDKDRAWAEVIEMFEKAGARE